MNLRDARRTFAEMRAAHTAQPEPIAPEPTAMAALLETEPPSENVLATVLASLEALPDDPDPLAGVTGPVIVTHPSNRARTWTCSPDDARFWASAGYIVSLPNGKNGSAS